MLEMIVRRPTNFEREVVEVGELSVELGLVGDNWLARGSRHTEDGAAQPTKQVALVMARFMDELCGGDRSRWPEAGDQLYVDLDLSRAALPAGTRVAIGPEAVLEITADAHKGCAKFAKRFGREAARLCASPEGQAKGLRGRFATVVEPGTIRTGDEIRRLSL